MGVCCMSEEPLGNKKPQSFYLYKCNKLEVSKGNLHNWSSLGAFTPLAQLCLNPQGHCVEFDEPHLKHSRG